MTFSLHDSTSEKDLRNGLKMLGVGDALPAFPPSPRYFQRPGHYLLTLDPPPPSSYVYLCLHIGVFGIKSVNLFLQYIKCHKSRFFPRILFLASSSCYDLCFLLLPFVGMCVCFSSSKYYENRFIDEWILFHSCDCETQHFCSFCSFPRWPMRVGACGVMWCWCGAKTLRLFQNRSGELWPAGMVVPRPSLGLWVPCRLDWLSPGVKGDNCVDVSLFTLKNTRISNSDIWS